MSTARPLRILYLADARSIHTQRWVGWFARRHEVRLISVPSLPAKDWDHPEIPLISGAPAYRTPLLSLLRITAFVRREIKRFRPDVVHAHYLVPNAWIAALTGFPRVVTTAWGSDLLRQPPRANQLNRLALRRAVLNTGDSQEAVDRLIALTGRRNTVQLVQFGVDTQAFAPAPASGALRREWQIPEGARVLVSPRILRPLYNGQTIAQAFIQVAAKHPDVHLIFLAFHAEQSYQQAVEKPLQAAGVLARVRFVPSVAHDQMPELYREAAAILSVPSSDTTPVSVLEAMACGSPIIASDLPSVREWVTPGVNGWLVAPGDANALAQAVESALALPELQKQAFAAAGRRAVVERASQDAEMTRMEHLYRQLQPTTR
ncbi:MAG TPA: glycosyltransferase [Polyangiales bacterium]